MINGVIAQYAARGNPGQYQLVEADGMFYILPSKIRNEARGLVDVVSIIDTPISFPERARSLQDTLSVIYEAVTASSGRRLGSGDPFVIRYIRETQVSVGATDEPARSVLRRALAVPGGPTFSWRLRYEPEVKYFVLALSFVNREVANTDGSVRLEAVLNED